MFTFSGTYGILVKIDFGGNDMKQGKLANKLFLFWYTHPRAAIGCMLIAINLLVIVLFTAILSIVSGNPFFDELSYLFTYTMCSDGIYDFVNNEEDLACFVIKIVLTVVQMIIFSGALIGFTTDLLQSTLDKRMRNAGKLNLSGHYVFLNWSAIGPNIIYDLSFLDGKKTVVILCEADRDEVQHSIENVFTENGRPIRDLDLLIKTGSPSSLKHLGDVSLDRAEYVGILLSEQDLSGETRGGITERDLNGFKVLMAILHMGADSNIVVETEHRSTEERITRFLQETDPDLLRRVSVFSHNSVIGHILGRAVIDPIYSHLFHQVLSYDGCEFYGKPAMDTDDALCRYRNCIPIINYDDDLAVDEDGNTAADQLYVLANEERDITFRAAPRSFARPIPYREEITREEFTLFIFSDSDRAGFVIDELNAYNALFSKRIEYRVHSYSEDVAAVAEVISAAPGNKKILLLSSEQGGQNDQDADVFIALLSLKISEKLSPDVPIFAEIVNPRNLASMQNLGVVSVIVSNKIISLFMVQLLTHPGSRRFYRDIVVTNGAEEGGSVDFDIIRAGDLLDFTDGEITFSCKAEAVHSLYHASGKTRLCVGVNPSGAAHDAIDYFCGDTDSPHPITLHPDDKLILITY